MATDMLTLIEEGMKELIEGMSEGAYFFTWGSVNEPDQAKQDFPSAEIMLEAEENNDEEDGAWASAYDNTCTYVITVKARLPKESSAGLQVYDIHKELNQALSDLKKVFGNNYTVGTNTCATIMYAGMEREFQPQGDILIPKRMITRWNVHYTQDRATPTTVGQ